MNVLNKILKSSTFSIILRQSIFLTLFIVVFINYGILTAIISICSLWILLFIHAYIKISKLKNKDIFYKYHKSNVNKELKKAVG